MVLTEQGIMKIKDVCIDYIKRMVEHADCRADGYYFATDVDIELTDGEAGVTLRADFHWCDEPPAFDFDRLDIVDADGEPTGEIIFTSALMIEAQIELQMIKDQQAEITKKLKERSNRELWN